MTIKRQIFKALSMIPVDHPGLNLSQLTQFVNIYFGADYSNATISTQAVRCLKDGCIEKENKLYCRQVNAKYEWTYIITYDVIQFKNGSSGYGRTNCYRDNEIGGCIDLEEIENYILSNTPNLTKINITDWRFISKDLI